MSLYPNPTLGRRNRTQNTQKIPTPRGHTHRIVQHDNGQPNNPTTPPDHVSVMLPSNEGNLHADSKKITNENFTRKRRRIVVGIVSSCSLRSIQYCAMLQYTSALHDKWLLDRRDCSFLGNSDCIPFNLSVLQQFDRMCKFGTGQHMHMLYVKLGTPSLVKLIFGQTGA